MSDEVEGSTLRPVGPGARGLERPGRRRRVPGGRQSRHVVRVTPEEEAQLLRLALAQNVSIPRLLVESALAQQGETPTERREAFAELFALHRLLSNIANNVNQIARGVNTDGLLSESTDVVFAKLRETAERIDQTMDRL